MVALPESLVGFDEGALLLLDKPLHWTSFDVVNKVRIALSKKLGHKVKVGHAGTLDPLATGLLILATGKATRQLEGLTGQDKEYTGTFTLGATTPSFDLETEPSKAVDTHHLTAELLQEATKPFIGLISQQPPAFSAIKVGGKPAYKSARKGRAQTMAHRPVTIHTFELTDIRLPEVDFRVVCSKGTYIRSLAHDFGQALKVGAYLSGLRRTAIGEFRVEDAFSVEGFLTALDGILE